MQFNLRDSYKWFCIHWKPNMYPTLKKFIAYLNSNDSRKKQKNKIEREERAKNDVPYAVVVTLLYSCCSEHNQIIGNEIIKLYSTLFQQALLMDNKLIMEAQAHPKIWNQNETSIFDEKLFIIY